MKKITNQIVYWTPRVLAILFILFVSMFALDVFSEGYGLFKLIGALLIHLIPTFLLIPTLIISWKWGKIGGIIFVLLGILFIPMVKMREFSVYLVFAGIPFLIGILFIIDSSLKKKQDTI